MSRHKSICVGIPLFLAVALVPGIHIVSGKAQSGILSIHLFAAVPFLVHAFIVWIGFNRRSTGGSYALLIGGLMGALPLMAHDYFVIFNQSGRGRSTTALNFVLDPIFALVLMLIGVALAKGLVMLVARFREPS